jgi:SAM-dependent methyltransferase
LSGRSSGAKRILLYNWPWYAATWGGAIAIAILAWGVGGTVAWVAGTGATVAALWSAISLGVSLYIYDRSALSRASWVRAFVPARAETWASIDAGLDAEVALEDVMPGACIARLDLYDGESVHAPSVRRARAITPRAHSATASNATALALADSSCDLIAVIFTAHEIRDASAREAFFLEIRRALRAGGRMLLVEHLRDAANFCAFGPGFVHFQPRAEWLRLARVAGLRVALEARVTPWVMAVALEKGS